MAGSRMPSDTWTGRRKHEGRADLIAHVSFASPPA